MNNLSVSEKNLVNKMLKDQYIKDFINENNVSNDEFGRYLESFMSYFYKAHLCDKCKGLYNCKQTRHGMEPILEKDGGYIQVQYVPCQYKEENTDSTKSYLHIYATSFQRVFDSLYVNENRQDILIYLKKFIETFKTNPHQKGLYISGSYGIGKSHLVSYLAVELTKQQVHTAFVYYPDFVRKIKSMIPTGGIDRIVEDLKRIPVLILDDFGGESNSNFIRDEILLPILQYRMVNKMPLFVTSNLDEKQILEHLAESSREVDAQKAARVFERLRTLCNFTVLKDKNYR